MNHLPTLLTTILVFAHHCKSVHAHSFLLKPKGDFRTFNKPECRVGGPPHAPNDNCPGPCIKSDSWQYDKNAPYTTYKRGEYVSLVWTKNNHHGGFVSFSLVPVALRMEKQAHLKMTIRVVCFDSDKHMCDVDDCGTDMWLFRTSVRIPTIYPDGDYVLGWTWYGGLMIGSFFSDYYSCAYVRIRGGEPLTNSYDPYFFAGENLGGLEKCQASVDRLGVCIREPCSFQNVGWKLPYQFSMNRSPISIRKDWMFKGNEWMWNNTDDIKQTPKPSAQPNAQPVTTPLPLPLYPNEATVDAKITGLQMVNADTAQVLGDKLLWKAVHLPPDVPRFTFVAQVQGQVVSVTFFLNGKWFRTETQPPYTFCGDSDGVYFAWKDAIYDRWFKLGVVALGPNEQTDKRDYWIRIETKN